MGNTLSLQQVRDEPAYATPSASGRTSQVKPAPANEQNGHAQSSADYRALDVETECERGASVYENATTPTPTYSSLCPETRKESQTQEGEPEPASEQAEHAQTGADYQALGDDRERGASVYENAPTPTPTYASLCLKTREESPDEHAQTQEEQPDPASEHAQTSADYQALGDDRERGVSVYENAPAPTPTYASPSLDTGEESPSEHAQTHEEETGPASEQAEHAPAENNCEDAEAAPKKDTEADPNPWLAPLVVLDFRNLFAGEEVTLPLYSTNSFRLPFRNSAMSRVQLTFILRIDPSPTPLNLLYCCRDNTGNSIVL